jgi:hypothetical protein
MRKIAVLAGNYREFQYFLRDIPPEEHDKYFYGDKIEKFRGLRLEDAIITGRFRDRNDYHELYAAAMNSLTPHQ